MVRPVLFRYPVGLPSALMLALVGASALSCKRNQDAKTKNVFQGIPKVKRILIPTEPRARTEEELRQRQGADRFVADVHSAMAKEAKLPPLLAPEPDNPEVNQRVKALNEKVKALLAPQGGEPAARGEEHVINRGALPRMVVAPLDALRSAVSKHVGEPALDSKHRFRIAISNYLFDGIGASTSYSSVFARMPDSEVTRVESLAFQGNLVPSRILAALGAPLTLPFALDAKSEINWSYRVKDSTNVATFKPRPPIALLALPMNCRLAKRMTPHTAVQVKTKTNIIAGMPEQLILDIFAGAVTKELIPIPSVLFRGKVSIQVARGDAKTNVVRLKLKLIDEDGQGLANEVAAPWNKLPGMERLRVRLNHFWYKIQGKRYEWEYNVDLSNPKACEAFDKALTGNVGLAAAGFDAIFKDLVDNVQSVFDKGEYAANALYTSEQMQGAIGRFRKDKEGFSVEERQELARQETHHFRQLITEGTLDLQALEEMADQAEEAAAKNPALLADASYVPPVLRKKHFENDYVLDRKSVALKLAIFDFAFKKEWGTSMQKVEDARGEEFYREVSLGGFNRTVQGRIFAQVFYNLSDAVAQGLSIDYEAKETESGAAVRPVFVAASDKDPGGAGTGYWHVWRYGRPIQDKKSFERMTTNFVHTLGALAFKDSAFKESNLKQLVKDEDTRGHFGVMESRIFYPPVLMERFFSQPEPDEVSADERSFIEIVTALISMYRQYEGDKRLFSFTPYNPLPGFQGMRDEFLKVFQSGSLKGAPGWLQTAFERVAVGNQTFERNAQGRAARALAELCENILKNPTSRGNLGGCDWLKAQVIYPLMDIRKRGEALRRGELNVKQIEELFKLRRDYITNLSHTGTVVTPLAAKFVPSLISWVLEAQTLRGGSSAIKDWRRLAFAEASVFRHELDIMKLDQRKPTPAWKINDGVPGAYVLTKSEDLILTNTADLATQ